MSRDYKIYLNDILNSIGRIEDYTKGISPEDLQEDPMREDAIIRNLSTIGEAVKNIPKEIRLRIPWVEWDDISGLRDILVHQYFELDIKTIWGIIKEDLPKLKRAVKSLLKSP